MVYFIFGPSRICVSPASPARLPESVQSVSEIHGIEHDENGD